VFDQAINACKCVAQTCCPQTYQFDAAHQKCVCTASACPGGLYCEQNVADPYFGVCKCADNTPCKSDQFCNADHFCQSLSGCTSSFDCPAGTFCDTITSVCRATGSCTMDEHCDPGQICRKSDGKCIAGCRRDEDCPLLPVPLAPGASQFSCQAGQCVQFCKSNEYCPLGKRCDQGSGTCLTIPSYDPYAALCQKCGAIGCGSSGVCLMFIAEGQLGSFCGVQCVSNDDCPSGYDCGNILYDCGQGGTCPDGSFCKQFQVENEPAPLSLCADPKTGWPKDFDTYCAPRSGTCPPENG
jgi:hypothetical protein